jgi:DNA-binding MarR family transcriptional regulator
MSPPITKSPILNGLKKAAAQAPGLADFPELALAASSDKVEPLDTTHDAFAGVMACLDTVNRLKLGARNALALGLLCQCGPMKAGTLAARLRIAPSSVSILLRRLEMLAMITTQRTQDGSGDRREVIVTPTQAARNVMACIVSLTALGQAANVLNKTGHKANGQSRVAVTFPV